MCVYGPLDNIQEFYSLVLIICLEGFLMRQSVSSIRLLSLFNHSVGDICIHGSYNTHLPLPLPPLRGENMIFHVSRLTFCMVP